MYGGTKEEMSRLVKDAAKIDKSIDANSLSYANIVQAIHVVQKEMGIAGTTAAEAEGTITGSLASVKGAWGNLLTALASGDDIDGYINDMTAQLEVFLGNMVPIAEKALAGMGTLVEKLAPIISDKLPDLAKDLLPPLIKAAVSLTKGLIKALPDIIKTLVTTIGDILIEEFPALKKFGDFFKENAGKISKFAGILLGLVAAFMAFSKIKSAVSVVSGLFGKSKGGSAGGSKGGLLGGISSLAKMKTTEVLKGMANLAIIFGGFLILAAAFLLVSPYIAQLGDLGSLLKVVAVIAALGIVGGVLAQFAGIAGKLPVTTVLKGLANMAIVLAGMAALFLLIGAISLIKFDLGAITGIVGIITLLGIVGTALTVFAAIVGLIPVAIVALGLANIGIIVAGMAALFLLIGAVSLLKFNYTKMLKIVGMLAILGAVGTALVVFAGIAGVIPTPIVLAGLANIALILGGMTALIIAFGALSKVKGINEFIETGGELLASLFGVIGKIAGSLLGGFAEGLTKSLPEIGKNLSDFAVALKPLFDVIKGTDMSGLGSFFGSVGSFLLLVTGNNILDTITGWFSKDNPFETLGNNLSTFAEKSKGFFTTVAGLPETAFSNAKSLFECLAAVQNIPQDGGTRISGYATGLSNFANKTSAFFTKIEGVNLEKVNGLWESLKKSEDLTSNLSKTVDKNISAIVDKISTLPEKMGDAMKKSGNALSDSFVDVWQEAVKASVAPVNKLLSGANHILKEFGSKKRVITWEPYAKGTNGHKGGNALVNDGRGAELVQMPNGNAFIPSGKNVLIPNAPKGMKVMSAERTAQLMGKKSPTYRYANGIGDLDIWSFIDNPNGLVNKISEKISYDGMSGFVLSVGKGMVSTFTGEMSAWVKKLFEEEGGQSISSYVASKGVRQWLPTVIRALKMEGQYSLMNVARTLFQMRTESGGNPRAINLWDSNAKKGIPSKGLMQVIDPTFKAYAREGFNKNIYDPLSNILASVRYAVSRYGSLAKAYRGVGYANGGVATKPSIFGEDGAEMAIPLSASKRNRALGLWRTTGEMLGVSYSPDSHGDFYETNSVEYNTYSPQISFTISGSNDDRVLARKIKRVVASAFNDMLDGVDRSNPKLREV